MSLASVRFLGIGWFVCFVLYGFFLFCFVFRCLALCVCVHRCCPWLLEWSIIEFRLKKKKCASLSLLISSFLCVPSEPFPHYGIERQLWPPVTITIENSILLILPFLILVFPNSESSFEAICLSLLHEEIILQKGIQA